MNICCSTLAARLRKLGSLTVAALIGALPGALRADFTFANFSSVAGINMVGNAAQVGARLRVTPATFSQAGAAWFTTKQGVGGGFTTTFQFQITPTKACEGDGFAFGVQNSSVSALGGGGGFMGYHGIPNSLVVEFDTFQNTGFADPNSNHVSVHTLGTSANSVFESASLGNTGTGLAVNLLDHLVHTARVTYTAGAPGSMSIFIDNLTTPVLTVPVNLASTLTLDPGGTAFVGFTSGTGACADDHDILSWSFTGTGAGACLAHAHGHVSTGSPGHFGGVASDHTHHAQHGTHLFPNPTCPPHAFGHKPGLTGDTGEGLFSGASAAPEPDFVAAVNVDGTAGPARRGAALQLFGSAAGLYLDDNYEQSAINFTPPASGSPLYYTTSVPEVRIGGLPAKVLFSGLAPGLTGTWQINVMVPEGAPRGRAPVSILYDGQPVTSIDVAVK